MVSPNKLHGLQSSEVQRPSQVSGAEDGQAERLLKFAHAQRNKVCLELTNVTIKVGFALSWKKKPARLF